VLRDRADRLEDARDELVSLRGTIEALSFVYEVPGHDGDDRVYIIRRGSVRAEMPAPRCPVERQAILDRAERLSPAASRAGAVRPAQAAEILLVARGLRRRPPEMERGWPDAMHDQARVRLRAIGAMV
jgi:excinuclease ABC subunit C